MSQVIKYKLRYLILMFCMHSTLFFVPALHSVPENRVRTFITLQHINQFLLKEAVPRDTLFWYLPLRGLRHRYYAVDTNFSRHRD